MTIQDKIKRLLEESILFTSEQKEAWLKLLPQMTENEVKELHSILIDEISELKKEGIDLISDSKLEGELLGQDLTTPEHGASLDALKSAAAAQPAVNSEFARELKREVTTPELRKPAAEEMGSPAPAVPKPAPQVALRPSPVTSRSQVPHPTIPKPPIPPMAPKLAPLPKELQVPHAPAHHEQPVPAGALKSLLEIRTVDDLKKIRTLNLRQGELTAQIDLIRAKILAIAQANKLLPFYTVKAFEESQLYKTYLTIGSNLILNPDKDRTTAFNKATEALGEDKLTLREFEAVADLRKQIEQL